MENDKQNGHGKLTKKTVTFMKAISKTERLMAKLLYISQMVVSLKAFMLTGRETARLSRLIRTEDALKVHIRMTCGTESL